MTTPSVTDELDALLLAPVLPRPPPQHWGGSSTVCSQAAVESAQGGGTNTTRPASPPVGSSHRQHSPIRAARAAVDHHGGEPSSPPPPNAAVDGEAAAELDARMRACEFEARVTTVGELGTLISFFQMVRHLTGDELTPMVWDDAGLLTLGSHVAQGCAFEGRLCPSFFEAYRSTGGGVQLAVPLLKLLRMLNAFKKDGKRDGTVTLRKEQYYLTVHDHDYNSQALALPPCVPRASCERLYAGVNAQVYAYRLRLESLKLHTLLDTIIPAAVLTVQFRYYTDSHVTIYWEDAGVSNKYRLPVLGDSECADATAERDSQRSAARVQLEHHTEPVYDELYSKAYLLLLARGHNVNTYLDFALPASGGGPPPSLVGDADAGTDWRFMEVKLRIFQSVARDESYLRVWVQPYRQVA
jgi:hypothetical protein